MINKPNDAIRCHSHGRELRRIETKFKSQLSVHSEISNGPSIKIELNKMHSPNRAFDKKYKNTYE